MAGKQEEQKQKYQVLVLRRDMAHIQIVVTENFAEAKQKYEELRKSWMASLTENKTFDLEEPLITSFDPGLIYEITLVPVPESMPNVNDGNPYKRKMMEKGLSGMQTSPILDGGYA